MPNQTIPIVMQWGPGTPAQQAIVSNEAGEIIAAQLAAAIRADITYITQVTNDPTTFVGQLIFNVPQNVFKSWDIGSGSYKPVASFGVGDVKNTFVGADSLATGWVLLNGRLISDIAGLSGSQTANLQSLFGSSSDTRIPTVIPANVSGLPQGNAFGSIPWPQILPVADTFANLTFTNPVTDAEADEFADDTETLRTTVDNVFTLVKAIQEVCQQQLTALNANTTPPLYAQIFVGFP